MSVSNTWRCLSCRIKSTATRSVNHTARSFHTSSSDQARIRHGRRSKFPNIKAEDMDLPETQQPEIDSLVSHLKPYTEHEKRLLSMKYTPEQMKAIEEGEKSIDADDMVVQGRFRTDKMRIEYIDDFATIRPMVDQPLKDALGAPLRPGAQPIDEAAVTVQKSKRTSKQQEEEDPHLVRLSKQTGMSLAEIKKLRVKVLVGHRVVNQTRLGKIASRYSLAVAGNENGMLGIGEGKSSEVGDSMRQARMNAMRNMKPVPRYEERTIFGESQGKVGATIVQLSTRPPGFGNRCQHLIFEMSRCAGITDLAARTPRSRNKMNVAKAAFKALTEQRLPEDVARSRGRKLVDVRNVYYGGSVY